MEFVIMLVNFMCTAFEAFASVFWHYVVSMHPVFVYCATQILQCGAVAFILYLIVHICRLIRHVDRLEQREERREERQNQTNTPITPAATVTPSCEPILIIRAEIDKMRQQTCLLEAELVHVEQLYQSDDYELAREAQVFQDQITYYERVLFDHVVRVTQERQDIIDDLQHDYNLTRHQLTAEQCAQREMGILQTRYDLRRRTTRLIMDEQARVDLRSVQQCILTTVRKRDNERRVFAAAELCLISHTQRLEMHMNEANSSRDHMIRISVAR